MKPSEILLATAQWFGEKPERWVRQAAGCEDGDETACLVGGIYKLAKQQSPDLLYQSIIILRGAVPFRRPATTWNDHIARDVYEVIDVLHAAARLAKEAESQEVQP